MISFGLKVGLGPIDQVDPSLILQWRNDYRVYRYCRQREPLTESEHRTWLFKLEDDLSLKMYGIFLIHHAERGFKTPVGVAGLTSIDLLNRRAEFSLYIDPTQREKGYGRDGLKVLCSHGFSSLGLHSIWGETYSFNPAREMFKKIGFQCEGLRREFYYREGRFVDAELYSLLKREWEENEEFDEVRSPCFT